MKVTKRVPKAVYETVLTLNEEETKILIEIASKEITVSEAINESYVDVSETVIRDFLTRLHEAVVRAPKDVYEKNVESRPLLNRIDNVITDLVPIASMRKQGADRETLFRAINTLRDVYKVLNENPA